MTDTKGCSRCGAVQDSVIHVLRDCKLAAAVWMLHGNVTVDHSFFVMELEDWLLVNLKRQSWMGSSGEEATIKFAVICWLLWKQRNEFVFQQKSGQPSDIVKAAKCMTTHIWEANCRHTPHVPVGIDAIKWQPPKLGWIKINADGAAARDEDWSAVGGTLRDFNGRWIVGYQMALNSKL